MEKLPIQKEFGEVTESIKNERIEIKKFGTENDIVGTAEFVEMPRPTPYIHLTSLNINPEERGKGFASQLMDAIEKKSQERGLPVLLVDDMDPNEEKQNKDAISMYVKRLGWKELVTKHEPPQRFYLYGTPDQGIVKQFIQRFDLIDVSENREKM